MRTRSALLALFFLVGHLSPGIQATPGASIVSFSVDSDGAVVVPVAIRNDGPFRFVLDTGSSHSVVSDTLAGHLKLRPVAQSRIVTSAGAAVVTVVQLDDVVVGEVVARRLMPSVMGAARLERLAPGVHGVLGRDFLASHDFTIDYRCKRLVWGAPYRSPAGINTVRVPLMTMNSRFVTVLRQDNGGEIVLVPDTGSAGIVLYDNNRSRRLPFSVISNDRTVGLTGLAGSRTGRPVHLKVLRIGTGMLRDQPAALVATSNEEHRGVDGLLPLHIFSRVSFRPAEGYLTIDW